MLKPGAQLELLCRNAQHSLILVAPFMKVGVIKRLLGYVATSVEVKCITRWRPDEILAGVSDLEVWDFLQSQPNTELWLRSDLHAKYYRADEQCLIGSANLTQAALGWAGNSNLEILISNLPTHPDLMGFEVELLRGSIQVDASIYQHIKQAVEQLKQQNPQLVKSAVFELDLEFAASSLEPISMECWMPTLRNPADLYIAYLGRIGELTIASREAALLDLQSLQIPLGLNKAVFEEYVGILLLQKPIIKKIDAFVTTPQRFGAVSQFLAQQPCAYTNDFNTDRAWQTIMRWLTYFLSKRYLIKTYRHSEVFQRQLEQ
ncbi:MAG: hypothetical protein BroJett018_20560 [Chloroflexota bacterium]|nr:MAG: hypothetical protein BroJett018_20560 [Chloroflexota bacterium]